MPTDIQANTSVLSRYSSKDIRSHRVPGRQHSVSHAGHTWWLLTESPPTFHNMIWKPLWYWENCSYTWLSCSASFLHDFLFMFACSSLKNSAFTLHWLFEVIQSLPDFCFLAQIKIYLCPSHMNKKDQNLRYKHVSDVKKNVVANIQLIFIFCCSMFYEVIINTELLSTQPLPLGKTQG